MSNNILVSGVLQEEIFFNIDFYGKQCIESIDYSKNNEIIVNCKNNIPDNFGITIHNVYEFNHENELNIFIEIKVLNENYESYLKYYDGKKYTSLEENKVNNNYFCHCIKLNKWDKKCRFFVENRNLSSFAIKSFYISDLKDNIIFKMQEWSPKLKSHYSQIKSYFLYKEIKNIFTKSESFMLLNSKYPTNYNFPSIKYIDVNNLDDIFLKNTLYLFVINFEYYDKLLESSIIKHYINKKLIKLIFRSCMLPKSINYNDGIYFLQNETITLPKSIADTLGNCGVNLSASCTLDVKTYIKYVKEKKIKQRIFVNTMGVSTDTKYINQKYEDNKKHILFIGRLVRSSYNIIDFINKIDNILDHDNYIIDILPGTFVVNNEKYDPRKNEHLIYLKSLFNKTINIYPTVEQKDVSNYITKADIGLDFPAYNDKIIKDGPEHSKLYEYISLGLPTVSQTTPNSYLINKFNCGIEINKACSPEDYYNGIINIADNINKYNREHISQQFIKEYSYKNLTYNLIRNIFYFYKELPPELLGNWNYSQEKIIEYSSYLENHKFLDRNRTIKNNWDRLINNFPEAFTENKIKFLDLSCGNGATLEILNFLGHDTFGIDYESQNHCFDKPLFHSNLEMNNKWPYKILLESQNLNFKGHDLNVIPYPFEDNSFDIVNSWGAIEFYGRPKYWKVFILEMLRICKNYVNITFNDIGNWLKDKEEYINEYDTFFNEMENQFSDYNVKIEKISDRHYKFLKQGKINISYLDLSNFKADEFISIGGECSVTQALKYLSLRNFSSPFDWLIINFDKIYKTFQSNFSIEKFLNINDIENINEFKGKFTTSDNVFYYHEQDCNLIDDVLIKYTRRLKRLNDILSCNKSIIFVRKSNNDTLEEIIKLEEIIIKMYPNINFKILFINPNVKTTHYTNNVIGVYLDEFHFVRWSSGSLLDFQKTWNHEHQTNDLNEIMCNCLKDVFLKFNIDKTDPFLTDINTIYSKDYISCKYIEKEHFITITKADKLPNNSGISFTFHKNIKTATLTFLAKKITENECYLKVYTGKKWIKFDEPLDSEYKNFSIVSEFDFRSKSKWRIGFKINTNEDIIYKLSIKNIKFL